MAKDKASGIRMTRNKALVTAVFLVAIASLFYYEYFVPKPVYSIQVGDSTINFRQDLREAAGVKVLPSEPALYAELMSASVKNITIAFKPVDETENVYYVLQGFLLPKLSRAYTSREPPQFSEPIVIDSYDGLKGSEDNIIIALVHPAYSDETAIVVKDHVIFLKAKDYKDFDLTTEKLFITAFNIKL